MNRENCCVLIPSLDPDEKLPKYVEELIKAQYGLILVIDDGSGPEYQPIFERIASWPGCHVLHHEVNRGKGAALRTGFAYILEQTKLEGVITADSDGQHTVADTAKLAERLDGSRAELLLGSRDFSRRSKQVPPKSRFGNRLTSGIFALLYSHWLPDTQTGLRGMSRAMLRDCLEITGDRFEYEMNQLIWCARHNIPMTVVPIETVYHNENQGTHFHPVRDSWRIYKLILGNFFRFMSTSLICFLVDFVLFTLLKRIPALAQLELDTPWLHALSRSPEAILLATVIARVCSASLNFILNKSVVFNIKKCKGAVWRYIVLCVAVMLVSGITVSALHVVTGIESSVIKIFVDLILFVVNYNIQRSWVFSQPKGA